MRRIRRLPFTVALFAAGVAGVFESSPVEAGNDVALGGPPTVAAKEAAGDASDRLIVRFRDPSIDASAKVAAIGAPLGERLKLLRRMSGNAHVVQVSRRITKSEAALLVRQIAADPAVAAVEVDVRMYPLRVPNDTMYGQQWHYFEAAGGVNLPAAWDISTGSADIRVAVIDTGVLPHQELAGRTVAGYDFIADATTANDGDGRDGNAADPGDYGCEGSTSSWHGTHVAGTVGAASNNGVGVAGVNWVSGIQPVRVLGRCGGYTSDIVDGMRWAAGIAVPGVPANATPSRVLNLSLGGAGSCGTTFQRAVDDVVARGSVVVVAAGNSSVDAAGAQPASCNNVIAVAATQRNGGRASYSNYGAVVDIAAPGGGSGGGVVSTLNAGTTTPGADSYASFQGTSMAAPHVSGIVSLMLSVAPNLTPAQVLQRLQSTARVFPTGTGRDCTTALCGPGIADAGAALAGLSPATWSVIAYENQTFTLNGMQAVRYGIGGSWVESTLTGSGTCSNAFFGGDPAYGTYKQCEVAEGSPWTVVASEGQDFTVGGTRTVRYGAGSSWVTRTVSGSGSCTNVFFGGDPAYGTFKRCEAAS